MNNSKEKIEILNSNEQKEKSTNNSNKIEESNEKNLKNKEKISKENSEVKEELEENRKINKKKKELEVQIDKRTKSKHKHRNKHKANEENTNNTTNIEEKKETSQKEINEKTELTEEEEKQKGNPQKIKKYKTFYNIEELSPEELLNYAITIFAKKPDKRVKKDISLLKEATKAIPFFVKTSDEKGEAVVENCLRFMVHHFEPKNNILMTIGSIGDKFYVILKGSVGVQINLPREIKQEDGTVKKFLALTEVATLKAGVGFGEIALINDAPRTATIVCKEDCDFATLDKKNFKRILAKAEKQAINDKIDFIASIPMFSHMRRRTIATLIFQFINLEFRCGNRLYNENEVPDNLYIVKSGEFKLMKTIYINKNEGVFPMEKRNFLPRNIIAKMKKQVGIGICGETSIIGEEEIVNNNPRKYTVICTSEKATVLAISRKDLMNRIDGTPELIALKNYANKMISWRERVIEQILTEHINNK